MIRIKEYETDDLPRYYRRLNDHMEMSSMWRNLQVKAEAGSTRSEKGYQMIAKSMAGRIARDLGYNPEKAEVLSACVGTYFPPYGQEGKRLIEQYLTKRDIGVDVSTLAIDSIEDYISTRLFVASDLDASLREYYSGALLENLQTPEVGVVRICQDAISKIKMVERFSNIDGGELLFNTSEDIVNASKAAGKPVKSAKLEQLVQSVSGKVEDRMTDEEKAEMIKNIDGFVKAFGKEGIYKYLSTDGR